MPLRKHTLTNKKQFNEYFISFYFRYVLFFSSLVRCSSSYCFQLFSCPPVLSCCVAQFSIVLFGLTKKNNEQQQNTTSQLVCHRSYLFKSNKAKETKKSLTKMSDDFFCLCSCCKKKKKYEYQLVFFVCMCMLHRTGTTFYFLTFFITFIFLFLMQNIYFILNIVQNPRG